MISMQNLMIIVLCVSIADAGWNPTFKEFGKVYECQYIWELLAEGVTWSLIYTVSPVIFIKIILHLVGFSVKGVVGGSLAAMFQSYMGTILANSAFSWLQSIAMKGVFTSLGPFMIPAAMAILSYQGYYVFDELMDKWVECKYYRDMELYMII